MKVQGEKFHQKFIVLFCGDIASKIILKDDMNADGLQWVESMKSRSTITGYMCRGVFSFGSCLLCFQTLKDIEHHASKVEDAFFVKGGED